MYSPSECTAEGCGIIMLMTIAQSRVLYVTEKFAPPVLLVSVKSTVCY